MAGAGFLTDWTNVTSSGRNDIVFQDKNKEYGAYFIRKNYNRTLILITSICCLTLLFSMSIPNIISLIFGAGEELVVPVTLDPALSVEPPPLDEKEPPPPPPPPPPVQNTVKFVPPEVKDEAVEEEPPPIQETETKISTETVKGDENATIEMPVEPQVVEEKPEEPFLVVEEMPTFPGGDLEMNKFINKNFQFPQIEKENHIGGTVYIGFVVDKEGNISDVQVLRGVKGGPGLEKEAIRVVKMMPKWKAGKNGGRAVPVRFSLPIKCQLK